MKIERDSGEVIEGVAILVVTKWQFIDRQDSLPSSFSVSTDEGVIKINTLDIKSIERGPSVLYEWSKRLF